MPGRPTIAFLRTAWATRRDVSDILFRFHYYYYYYFIAFSIHFLPTTAVPRGTRWAGQGLGDDGPVDPAPPGVAEQLVGLLVTATTYRPTGEDQRTLTHRERHQPATRITGIMPLSATRSRPSRG